MFPLFKKTAEKLQIEAIEQVSGFDCRSGTSCQERKTPEQTWPECHAERAQRSAWERLRAGATTDWLTVRRRPGSFNIRAETRPGFDGRGACPTQLAGLEEGWQRQACNWYPPQSAGLSATWLPRPRQSRGQYGMLRIWRLRTERSGGSSGSSQPLELNERDCGGV